MDDVHEVGSTDGAKVFISYSRKDITTVESLRDALISAGFVAYLDLRDILPGEPWQERLGALIESAYSVVFVLSPNSVASRIVDWEVNEAERLGKRVLPVVVQDTDPDRVPNRIKRLNYIHMRNATEWASGLAGLCEALRTDIVWLRKHTRLSERATEWIRGNHALEFLLRGEELRVAEAWISTPAPLGSVSTPLQRNYIKASQVEALAQATRRGRAQIVFGILIVAVLFGLAYLTWLNRNYLEFQARLFLDSYMPTVLSESTERSLLPGQTFKECASCPEMVVLPTGKFIMGSVLGEGRDSEHPQREVVIEKSFAVAKLEITFFQWDACIAHGGCAYRPDDQGWGRRLIPVTSVSWNDAKQYVAWLSSQTGRQYRLLAETEWEYAARAGSKTKFPWGNELEQGHTDCEDKIKEEDQDRPSPVGSFPPNEFGLYDMVGNLWEWVEDNWHSDYNGAPQNGAVWTGGDASMRVMRGRGYGGVGECYVAFRDFSRRPDGRTTIFGIRVARSLGSE